MFCQYNLAANKLQNLKKQLYRKISLCLEYTQKKTIERTTSWELMVCSIYFTILKCQSFMSNKSVQTLPNARSVTWKVRSPEPTLSSTSMLPDIIKMFFRNCETGRFVLVCSGFHFESLRWIAFLSRFFLVFESWSLTLREAVL